LTRPSTTFFVAQQDVDARHKAGHDEKKTKGRERSRPFFLFVIASEAKQSIVIEALWIASSLRSSQ